MGKSSIRAMGTRAGKGRDISSIFITILLLVQVGLSAGIVMRIINLDQRLTLAMNMDQTSIPGYVEDVSIDDDPTIGAKGAPITIIAFSDYECPFCAEAVGNIRTILMEYKDKIMYVYRDFPLEHIHPHAFKAAEAANCAGDQGKYWDMHDQLFENQTRLDSDSIKRYAAEIGLDIRQFTDCLEDGNYVDEVRHDIEDGKYYEVTGTPTFFINGNRIVGGTIDQLRQVSDMCLREEGE